MGHTLMKAFRLCATYIARCIPGKGTLMNELLTVFIPTSFSKIPV